MAARRGRAVAALLVLLWLAGPGCGGGDVRGTTAAGPVAETSGITEWSFGVARPEGWTIVGVELTSLRMGSDDRALEAEVVLRPVRLPSGTCAGDVGAWVEDEGNQAVVWLRIRAAVPDVGLDDALLSLQEDEPCPVVPTPLEVDMAAPLDGRAVQVESDRWVADDDGAFRPCVLPDCDPSTGRPPVQASCADGSTLVEDVRQWGDVGTHAAIVERRCEGTWAMVEVDIGAGACPPTDGADPCAGQRVDRLMLRAGTPLWEVIHRTRAAGCGDVAEADPTYPLHLCADRPALG